jgi:hypothetical protein
MAQIANEALADPATANDPVARCTDSINDNPIMP